MTAMDAVAPTFLRRRWPGITYLLQVLLLYIVIIASIVNLSLCNGNDKVWLGLLTSSIGLLLPNPRFDTPDGSKNTAVIGAPEVEADGAIEDPGAVQESKENVRERIRILHPYPEQLARIREQP
ncbi:MAG: hypothetical protein GY696_34805 [Gammaproteobacteria bacterium]|nr:hypothetical protein [Gammaproteobacteria bacterium]